jgi:uncharacterized cupin superfamily protein
MPLVSAISAITPSDVVMTDAPIDPRWVRGGSPRARESHCSTSRDGSTSTWVWDCTAGEFDWYFPVDETVHILEGEVTVSADGCPPRVLRQGDAAVFQARTWARWEVPTYVRKHAVLRAHIPAGLRFAMRVHARLTRRQPGPPPHVVRGAVDYCR